MPRKKLSTTVYITPEQDARLKLLHSRTKVPVAEYIRQGIDLILDKYRASMPGQVDIAFRSSHAGHNGHPGHAADSSDATETAETD